MRLDSPTGTLVGTTPTITPTGGWQTFKDVSLDLTSPPTGTHELFLVFRKQGSTQNLFNVNWFEVVGKGAATTASPEVTATADAAHRHRAAGRQVRRHGDRPRGQGAHLRVGLRRARHRPLTPRRPRTRATRHPAPGNYPSTLTVTDKRAASRPSRFRSKVDSASCSATFRDDFNGSDLDSSWSVIRRDQTLTVTDGALNIVTQNGDVYQTANTAKNIVLRTAPSGAWTITTKLNVKGNVQYQQAGLIVYGDDDNYTKFDRVATNAATGGRRGEVRVHQRGRGHAAQRQRGRHGQPGGGVPGRLLHGDRSPTGRKIKGEYSTDGTTWTKVGQAAALPRQRQGRLLRAVQRGGHAT